MLPKILIISLLVAYCNPFILTNGIAEHHYFPQVNGKYPERTVAFFTCNNVVMLYLEASLVTVS